VPLQGHWQRVNTPLRQTTRRERRLVKFVVALLAVAVAATVVVAIATSSSGPAAGCIRVELPSTMGGSSTDLCGPKAEAFCKGPAAHKPPLNVTALPKCRDAGYE
jgi:hypothetical protein